MAALSRHLHHDHDHVLFSTEPLLPQNNGCFGGIDVKFHMYSSSPRPFVCCFSDLGWGPYFLPAGERKDLKMASSVIGYQVRESEARDRE